MTLFQGSLGRSYKTGLTVLRLAYLVNISRASSSYAVLCSGVSVSKVSSFIKALEHIPNALLAVAAKAEIMFKKY